MSTATITKEKIKLFKKSPQSYEDQFPWSQEFAQIIKEDRASTPFRVRYQEFQENKNKYSSLFTTIIRKRWK